MIEKGVLVELYADQQKNTSEIARELGVSDWTVRTWLHKHRIALRSKSESLVLAHKKHNWGLGVLNLWHTRPEVMKMGKLKAADALRMRRILKQCELCGQGFSVRINVPRRFCSRSCVNKHCQLTKTGPFSKSALRKRSLYMKNRLRTNPIIQPPEIGERHSIFMKKLWKDESYQRKQAKASNPPNKLEKNFGRWLFKRLNLPIAFTGDKSFFVAGQNPDFVVLYDLEPILVDLYGFPWHTKAETEERQIAFLRAGYRHIGVWTDGNYSSSAAVKRTKDFLSSQRNGLTITLGMKRDIPIERIARPPMKNGDT